MRPSDQKPVNSPYVVVLGGGAPRRKSTPPPDADLHHGVGNEREVKEVRTVVSGVKTMAHDLATTPSMLGDVPKTKRRWWPRWKSSEKRKEQKQKMPAETIEVPHARVIHEQEIARPERHVIDVPSDTDREPKTPYRARFLRGIAKKGYLTSKLSIELPFHAKAGIGIALLVLVVGVPVLSRFMEKPAPVTAGTIVAMGTEALVAQVSKSIELPVEESPLVVVATADDIRRLNVPDSKPGDKVLIYQKTGKIVVYDAEKDKVLGVVNRSQP